MIDDACIVLPQRIPVDRCRVVRELGDALPQRPGRAAPGGERRVRMTPMTLGWVEGMVNGIFAQANSLYGFELYQSQTREPMQYLTYCAGDHYDWHIDRGAGTVAPRKLACIIQLSAPEEYEGGEVVLKDGAGDQPLPRDLGTAIVFPTWILHTVRRVTRGERRALVAWAHGPEFR